MKKQVIQQLQNTLEWVMQEWINTKQELAEVRIELEETQEALRRNRRLLDSYKMFESLFESEQVIADILAGSLQSAENEIRMYENMNLYTFFIHKYFK